MVKKIVFIMCMVMAAINCVANPNVTKEHTVKVTCYQPVAAQCNSNPTVTADGSKINMNKLKQGEVKWCAVSRDLLKHYPYGSKIYIEGHGWYEVHDTCNKRYTNLVDILIHPTHKGFCKKGVKISNKA